MTAAIKRKIIFFGSLAASLVVAAVITVLGVFYLLSMESSLWRQLVQDVTEVAEQGAHAFETYVYKESVSVNRLAQNLAQLSPDENFDLIRNIFDLYAEDGIYTLSIYNDDGSSTLIVAGAADYTELSAHETERRYGHYGEQGITEPYINDLNGHSTIGYYERLTFADGSRGLIRKGQLISYVRDEFSLTYYNDTGFSYIVKLNGDIMIRPTHKDSNHTFSNFIDMLTSEKNDDKTVKDIIKNMESGNRGAARVTFNGEDYVVAFTPLKISETWYLISLIPNSAISQHSNSIFDTTQIIVIVVVIVIALVIAVAVLLYVYNRKMAKNEAEVRYREQLFDLLVNSTDDVFLMLAANDFSVEYVSPNTNRVLGVASEEIKKDIKALGRGEYAGGANVEYDELKSLPDNGQIEYESERVHKESGEHRFYKETVYRTVLEGEERFIIVLSDRTVEKYAARALTNAMENAKQANMAKSVFLSNMSHDIRTPMNAILGFVELIKRDAKDAAKVVAHAQKMSASGHHLLQLINDVLDMSKIENGKFALNITEFNLAEFVDELGSIIRPQAKAKNLTFDINVRDIKEEYLLGDALRLNQVLINILSNAVKYTPRGGRIELGIRELPRINENFAHLEFVVSDTGIGMSKAYIDTVFEPFSREVSSTVNKIQGTGLGLTITKNLVDLMGGNISVESEPEKGSTFRVELELRIDEKEVELEFWQHYGIKKALVVDDNEDSCKNVTEILTEEGLEVSYKNDGASAIKAVEQAKKSGEKFDLVLLDMVMPGMDGRETAKKIRKIAPKGVSVVMLSAYDLSDLEELVKEGYIDAFLPKPFFLSNLKLNVKAIKEKGGAATDETEEEFSLNGKNFLAAEDNDLNSEILVELLDMEGATCDVSINGAEVVKAFEASELDQYDAILMDIQMPIMNGYDATRNIRNGKHPRAKTIPIIAMTANAFSEDVNRSFEAGMNAHVAKPVDVGLLMNVIKDLLKKQGKIR